VFYVVQHKSEPRVKFGITIRDGSARLRSHRKSGYTTVLRLVTGLPGRLARDTEDAVRSALALAGHRPVKGWEHFDTSCLGLILDVADSWLSGHDSNEEDRRTAVSEINGSAVVDGEVDDWEDDGIVRAKWTIDGAATLAEAAQKAREFAGELQRLHDEGNVLREPIADDYGMYYKP
jgi:hypothetical protein